ncbi:MAG: 4'-phosphopantetheinyl transferase superfamily protein [Planctomycetota bacterium]
MSDRHALAAALRGLLPPSVAAEVAPVDLERLNPPFPLEGQGLEGAVAKRRAEFSAGRRAAHAALAALGVPAAPLIPSPRRDPLWPAGVVGSIAHSGAWALAAAARAGSPAGVGLDVEPAQPLKERLARMILTPEERARAPWSAGGLWLRRAFCAKEAVYKAQYPLTQRFLEFEQVTLEPAGDDAFLATVPGWSRPVGGRWVEVAGYLLCAVCLEHGPDQAVD